MISLQILILITITHQKEMQLNLVIAMISIYDNYGGVSSNKQEVCGREDIQKLE